MMIVHGVTDGLRRLKANPDTEMRYSTVANLVEIALQAAAGIARDGCLVPPDGGSPTQAETEMCNRIYDAILGLIPDDPSRNKNKTDDERALLLYVAKALYIQSKVELGFDVPSYLRPRGVELLKLIHKLDPNF